MNTSSPPPITTFSRLPDEPILWYARFLDYCALGPTRSINTAYRTQSPTAAPTAAPTAQAPGAWSRNARRFHWLARARIWDDAWYHHALSPAQLADLRARDQHLAHAEQLLDATLRAIENANLANLDEATARANLATLRGLARDFFKIAHRERRILTETATPDPAEPTKRELHFTAEDFAEAERLARIRLGRPYPSGILPTEPTEPP